LADCVAIIGPKALGAETPEKPKKKVAAKKPAAKKVTKKK